MNIQFAIQNGEVFILEVNPRASRTVPFVAKAIGRPLAKLAALVMAGKSLAELGFTEEVWPRHYSVKEAVFPFVKFPGADTLLGPEMKSTGEVMGIDSDFGRAYAKSQIQAGNSLPTRGRVLVSVKEEDRAAIGAAVRDSASLRRTALLRGVPYFTTVAAARAGAGAIRALQNESIGVRSLQEIHPRP